MKTLLENYEQSIDFKIYKSGKDFSYIKKYGFISKSVLIVNEKIKITDLSNENVKKIIKEYMEKR